MQPGESRTNCLPDVTETGVFSWFGGRGRRNMNGKTEFMPDERDLAIKAKHSNKDTPESRPDMF